MSIAEASTDTTGSGQASSFAPTLPTVSANDVCVLYVAMGNSSADPIGITAGWTEEAEVAGGSFSKIACYTRRMTGGDSAPTVDFNSTIHRYAWSCSVWSGVNTTTLLDVAVATNSGSSPANGNVTAATITTATDGAMLVYGFTRDGPGTWTPDGSQTETSDVNEGTSTCLEVAYEARATAGAVGTRTAVNSNTNIEWAAISLALRPAANPKGFIMLASGDGGFL